MIIGTQEQSMAKSVTRTAKRPKKRHVQRGLAEMWKAAAEANIMLAVCGRSLEIANERYAVVEEQRSSNLLLYVGAVGRADRLEAQLISLRGKIAEAERRAEDAESRSRTICAMEVVR